MRAPPWRDRQASPAQGLLQRAARWVDQQEAAQRIGPLRDFAMLGIVRDRHRIDYRHRFARQVEQR